jgi:hypothetical protein
MTNDEIRMTNEGAPCAGVMPAALHNGARAYCQSQISYWRRRYDELSKAGRNQTPNDKAWAYTDDAKNIFPRHGVLTAILHEVERFIPADFANSTQARELILLAGQVAEDTFSKDDDPISRAASANERDAFCRYISTADFAELQAAPQLPFRRVLGRAEHVARHIEFCRKWGKWYGGGVQSAPAESKAVTLHEQVMHDPPAYAMLRDTLLNRHGVGRIFELREFDEGYELLAENASFTYNGAEGFWTSGDMSWMVYASHESSITFGGECLIQHMRERLGSFDHWLYKGWDLKDYGNPE